MITMAKLSDLLKIPYEKLPEDKKSEYTRKQWKQLRIEKGYLGDDKPSTFKPSPAAQDLINRFTPNAPSAQPEPQKSKPTTEKFDFSKRWEGLSQPLKDAWLASGKDKNDWGKARINAGFKADPNLVGEVPGGKDNDNAGGKDNDNAGGKDNGNAGRDNDGNAGGKDDGNAGGKDKPKVWTREEVLALDLKWAFLDEAQRAAFDNNKSDFGEARIEAGLKDGPGPTTDIEDPLDDEVDKNDYTGARNAAIARSNFYDKLYAGEAVKETSGDMNINWTADQSKSYLEQLKLDATQRMKINPKEYGYTKGAEKIFDEITLSDGTKVKHFTGRYASNPDNVDRMRDAEKYDAGGDIRKSMFDDLEAPFAEWRRKEKDKLKEEDNTNPMKFLTSFGDGGFGFKKDRLKGFMDTQDQRRNDLLKTAKALGITGIQENSKGIFKREDSLQIADRLMKKDYQQASQFDLDDSLGRFNKSKNQFKKINQESLT